MFSDTSNDEGSSEDDFDISNVLSALPSSKDFVKETRTILMHAELSGGTDATETALIFNQEMQKMLHEMKATLEALLQKCRIKYKHNEEKLKTKDLIRSHYKSYQVCGIPFFKTRQKFSHPSNDDYISRKRNQELFPIDILCNKQNSWSLKDKTGIIRGVKEQIIEHLSSKKRNEPSTSVVRENRSNKQILSSESLFDLLSQCDNKFKICWYRISSEFLKHRFKDHSCEAMWNMYLKPGISRDNWTEEENKTLKEAALENNFQNWRKIAEFVKSRSELQCFIQYYTGLIHCQSEKITKWTPEDDEKLLKAVKKCRMNNVIRWNKVKQHFPNLTRKQLHHRYKYSINPTIIKAKFTWNEDCAILAAIERHGENFQAFPLGLFPGRTIVQIRNRWHNSLKYSGKRTFWTIEEDKKLVELIGKHGEGNYSIISNELTNKSRSSIRQRYGTIKKFLQKNPNCDLDKCPRRQKPFKTDLTLENWQQKVAENVGDVKGNIEVKALHTNKYYNSLRKLEKGFYQFFKFSYDYSFNKETLPVYSNTNLNLLVNLLEVRIDKNFIFKQKIKFNSTDYSVLQNLINFRNKESSKKNDQKAILPPSWSTLLGFRGVCIQCASTIHTRTEIKHEENIEYETAKGNLAKDLFRKRFYALFYKTAILSRLENSFIPHEILLSNSKILQNLAKSNLSIYQENVTRKRRLSSPDPDLNHQIKEIKLEN